jgi:hypothetical protein
MAGRRKLTDAQVLEIRRRVQSEPYKVLTDEFGISKSMVSRIKNNNRRNVDG